MGGQHKDRYTTGIAVGNEFVYPTPHWDTIFPPHKSINSTLTIAGVFIRFINEPDRRYMWVKIKI